ncbi:MAG: YiiX/YebB-like N1pC/P60 family cysteine hydrolase [Succinivibrio sp.]|nr:hypothetical protein [Succinivibrio sp.]MDY5188949.1 YiiX/YebB-like N1pC/P60 family cysteine hydrolase [Succinivibrio sp.]MDY5733702.1 YiiX/YebB-like N1pC/P60 family cysteine hydrolase [Succinivibrio sp.]
MHKALSILKPSAKVLIIVLSLGFCIFSLIKNADPYFDTSRLPKLQIGDLVLRKGTVLDSSIITHLSKSNYSHIGIISALTPQIMVTHATTDDELTHKDAVVTTPLKLFLAKAFSKKTAIIRLNFIDDEKAKLIVDKVKQKLGYPYYITGDKYSPKKLYCTSLLYDAIKEVYPKFSLQYQHINQPIFKGDYLFVEAFFQIKDKTLLYQR